MGCLLFVFLIGVAQTMAFNPFSRIDNKKSNLKKKEKVSVGIDYYFTQNVDHFDGQNNQTWQQRYFINATYFQKTSTSPVFLCVGGETDLDSEVVVTGEYHCADMIVYAQTAGALILALEHRYYGASNPTADFSTPNMRFLSSEQALADIATFYSYISASFNLTSNNRWIAFGGSYPGMLAAWIRLKYPHLIWASVASSAPVRAIANFQGYNDVVAQSMAATDVGGSTNCANSIQQAFQVLGQNLGTSNGRRALEQQFKVCVPNSLDNINNQVVFMLEVSGVFPVQGNDPACTDPACNISACCGIMLNTSLGDPLARLAQINTILQGGSCLDTDYIGVIKDLSDTTKGNMDRSWFYQTCTEFGFYQTCDPGTQCLFTTNPWLNNLTIYYQLCQNILGVNQKQVDNRIAFSNLFYGSDQPASSRILWVNGEIDPWHSLSVLDALSQDQPAYWVVGASHHAWTHVPAPTDQPSVVAARQFIQQQVTAWLAIPY